MNEKLINRVFHLRWRIFSILGIAYILVFFNQMSVAIVANDIMKDLACNATAMGVMASIYFYVYAAMQIPAGLLCDSIGSRKTVSFSLGVAAIGALIFGFSNFIWNNALNIKIASIIKKRFSKSPIVFGGPNFPLDKEDREYYLNTAGAIDFYIPFEGEAGFSNLITSFIENEFNIQKTKESLPRQAVYMLNDRLHEANMCERMGINDIPSPTPPA